MITIKELVAESESSFCYYENKKDVTDSFFKQYYEILSILQQKRTSRIFLLLDGSFQSSAILLASLSVSSSVHLYSQDISLAEISTDIFRYSPELIFCPRSRTRTIQNFVDKEIYLQDHLSCFETKLEFFKNKVFGLNEVLVTRTSGSTGSPKYLLIDEDTIKNRFENLIQTYHLHRNLPIMVGSSFHQTITIRALLSALSLKGHFISIFPFNPKNWLEIFYHDYRFALLVPPQVRKILQTSEVHSSRKNGEILISSSTTLNKEKRLILESISVKLFECYGTVEVAIATSVEHSLTHESRLGSVGSPVNGAELRIQPDDSAILIRSSLSIRKMVTVVEDRVEIQRIPEWYATGDVGYLESGELYLLGRKNDRFDVGGSKVFPMEIENVALAHPNVKECLAFRVDDEILGDRVGLAVILRSSEMSNSNLISFCATRLEPFKVPQIILRVDEIPLTNAGKPDRIALEERFKYEK